MASADLRAPHTHPTDKEEGQRPVKKLSFVRAFWCHITWLQRDDENHPVRLLLVRGLAL